MAEQVKSLAEFLGANQPSQAQDARPLTAAQRRMSIREFCKGILQSQEYRDSIVRRIMFDALPAQVEQLIYFYAEGKPVERIEVDSNGEGRFAELTIAQLRSRAAALMQLADAHEQREKETRSSDEEQGSSPAPSSYATH